MDESIFYDLPNEVWINIFSYLAMRDQRFVRLVSKRFQQIIDFIFKYMQKSILKISENNIKNIKNRIENQIIGNLSFKNLKLTRIKSSEDLRYILEKVGHEIQYLSMEETPAFDTLKGKVPHLKAFQLNFDDALRAHGNRLNLCQLPHLEELNFIENAEMPDETNSLLLHLKMSSNVKRLKLAITNQTELELLNLLELHSCNLEYLNLHFSTAAMLPNIQWKKIFSRMNKLRTFHLTGNCRFDWLKIIFNSIPHDTQMEHIELSGLSQLNDTILMIIINKWSCSLQEMELMYCGNITDSSIMEFGKCPNLRVLNLSHCNAISNEGILRGVAANINPIMEELYISDLPKLDEYGLSIISSNMPNLRILNLNNLPKAVTNAALTNVFRQTKLRELYMDDCIQITDEGLIGLDNNTYSIRRLGGLEKLSLRNCRNLSNRTLTEALHFPELRTLKLGYCHKITTRGIEQMIKNSPSIENIVISSCLMVDDNAILAMGKGLKRLNKLNISNCTKLTEKSMDYIVHNFPALEDLTACGLDPLRIWANQKHLMSIKPRLKELQW